LGTPRSSRSCRPGRSSLAQFLYVFFRPVEGRLFSGIEDPAFAAGTSGAALDQPAQPNAVETPRHGPSLHELEPCEISDVIRAYVARIVDLKGDKRMRYVLGFKNQGEEAGAIQLVIRSHN